MMEALRLDQRRLGNRPACAVRGVNAGSNLTIRGRREIVGRLLLGERLETALAGLVDVVDDPSLLVLASRSRPRPLADGHCDCSGSFPTIAIMSQVIPLVTSLEAWRAGLPPDWRTSAKPTRQADFQRWRTPPGSHHPAGVRCPSELAVRC
jgi:hypothetical protein